MSKIAEIIKRRDGRLHVYRHDNSRTFLWRTFLDGKYFVQTTHETNRAHAIETAENAYDELRFKKKQGIPVHSHTFEDACREMLAEQKERMLVGERSPTHLNTYEMKLRTLEPFFSRLPLQKIDADQLQQYKSYRIQQSVTRLKSSQKTARLGRVSGQSLSMKTLHNDFIVLRQILKVAKRKGWINTVPDFPTLTIKSNARPYFSLDDYRNLLKISRQRIKRATERNMKLSREELHDYIIFLTHTGVLIGEAQNIRLKDVTFWDGNHPTKISTRDRVFIKVKGKTGERETVGMFGAVSSIKKQIVRRQLSSEDKVFPFHNCRQLVELLDEAKLRYTDEGRRRDFKSFRHSYIVFRLLDGVDIYLLAKNCGTSVKVIESNYGKHLTPRMKSDELTKLDIKPVSRDELIR
jgi:integrase